ncbi:unnamed protein product [Effrenium voratum]|uniref:Uncharacterized protein n=1 Tax=Effrenium voratum TaxID=2562239 RepID=A0AA36HTZ4_9DINO|nr:unnamed protein product [Effrenium voratum]
MIDRFAFGAHGMERSFSSAPIESVSVPMWVVKASTLLLFDTMPCHEELAEKGLLVRLQEGIFCIFVSHQWLGTFHPDPTGEQLRVLQDTLRNLMRGEQIGTDITLEFWLQSVRLSEMHRSKLKDAYIWLDWLSIPQQDAGRGNRNPADELGQVVESTPSTSVGSVEGPAGQANVEFPTVLVTAADKVEFVLPMHWLDNPPQDGAFSYTKDREVVLRVMEKALRAKLRLLKDTKKWNLYRYYMARYDILLGQPCRQRSPEEFQRDFRFESLASARGMTPMACAALSGDANMVSQLCDAQLDVDRFIGTLPEVYIMESLTPLMLTMWLGWRCHKVANALLERRANANATTAVGGEHVLSFCKTPAAVDLLVQHRADVNRQQGGHFKLPPITSACGRSAPTSVIAALLKHGADVNPRRGAAACNHPFVGVAYRWTMSESSTEVAKLLLDARADVNAQRHGSGIGRLGELTCRGLVMLRGSKAPKVSQFFAEWSTTPLGFACFFGAEELVELLLEAKADCELRNARGRTPLQLTQSAAVLNVLHRHQTTFSI